MKIKEEYKGTIIGKRINGKMIEFDTNKGNYEYYFKNGFEECFEIEKMTFSIGDCPKDKCVCGKCKKKVIKYVGVKEDRIDDSRDLDADQEENS